MTMPDDMTGQDEPQVAEEPQQQTQEEQRSLQAQQPAVVQDETPRTESGLTPEEELRLGELLEKRNTATEVPPVRLKVEGPHDSVTVNGVTVGREFTEVPAHVVADLLTGAESAGVKITQDQES